jgi:hypothetical protein
MAVPYETAISTIQSVLNNSVEREIICAVLEANDGHMERTIEYLLSMSGEIPHEETSVLVPIVIISRLTNVLGTKYYCPKSIKRGRALRQDDPGSVLHESTAFNSRI